MNLIEKLKNNEKPYGLNTKEERGCFEKVGRANCLYLQPDITWKSIDCIGGSKTFHKKDVYCIKLDYQPEPGVEKCEVDRKNPYRLRYKRKERVWVFLHEAFSDPDFMYFEFEDGFKSLGPRLTTECSRDEPAPVPKYVVFRKAKK